MAPIKRSSAAAQYDDSDLDSERSASQSNSRQTYTVSTLAHEADTCPALADRSQRKKRRITPIASPNDSSVDEANPPYRQRSASVDSNEEAEYEILATQAIREKNIRERQNVPAECGVLEEVHVVNFMCHDNFMFKLGPLINFICGKNGSGKSAILTALTLCLGGKTSATNRGQSLKSFIKEGKEAATITVKIKNTGDGAYMPEEYGTSISVERTFSKTGSSGYKLRNEKGRIVSTKKLDLEEICDHFALQIDNPMNVLSQDMARQFIGSSSAADKYKFFVKGVQLEQLDQDYRIIEEIVDNIECKLEARSPDVEILRGRMEKAKSRLEMSDKANSMRDKQRHYRRQWAWAQVETQERIRDDYIAALQNADEETAHAKGQLGTLDAAFQAADQASNEAADVSRQAESEVGRVQNDKAEAKEKHDEIKKVVVDAHGEQRAIRETLKQNERLIIAKQREILEERQRLDDLDGGGAATRLQRLEEAKEEAKAAKEAFNQHQADKAGLDNDARNAERMLKEYEQLLRSKRDEIERRKSELDALSRDQGEQDTIFHPQMPALLRAIQNERSFAERPVGPIGKHIRLLQPQWSLILEKSFGGTLSSFIVTSKGDMNILNALMGRVRCSCPIIIGNNQPLDTSPQEPDADFETILRVLEIDNDLVRKQLVIQHGIEQTILIADMQHASQVLYSSTRPRNVKRCFSINAHNKRNGFMLSYTRNGEASQDPIHEYQGRPRMRTDIEAQVRLRQEALHEARQDLNRLDGQHRTTRDDFERAQQALVRHRRRMQDLQIASQRADDNVEHVAEAIREDSIENGKLEVLQSALAEAEEAKAMHEGSYQDAVVALDNQKEQLNAARNTLIQMDERIAALQAESRKLEVIAQKASKQRATALGEKNAAIGRIDDAKQDRGSLEQKAQEHEAKVEEWIAQASIVCLRVSVDDGETEESVKKKYQKLTSDINTYQQQMGASREDIATEARNTDEAYESAKRQMEELEKLAWTLKASLIERRERWKKFRSFISCRAKAQFTFLLSERSFRGRLITDHKQKLLELSVEPDITKKDGSGRGAKTLSGGEKSFSQICLLLSIWEAMGSPIRCLDEFDVFMDSVNRKMSIDLLTGAARQSIGRQFVLISPGSKSDITRMNDINVHE